LLTLCGLDLCGGCCFYVWCTCNDKVFERKSHLFYTGGISEELSGYVLDLSCIVKTQGNQFEWQAKH
jgi:hypothetical protein